MDFRAYLTGVASGYATSSIHSPGHALLADAASQLMPLLPAGLIVNGSGGKGNATHTPWIGVFDPDETHSPQEGIYVVYIFSAGLDRVVLTLNQGVGRLRAKYGDTAARSRLAADAQAVRAEMGTAAIAGTLSAVTFGMNAPLQRAYEAGNICALEYTVTSMPAEATLRSDLLRFVSLYQDAIAAKRELLQREPGSVSSSSAAKRTSTTDPLRDFAPKDDRDYLTSLSGKPLVRTRRHEALVRAYGTAAKGMGLDPATNVHPRDLTLFKDGREWLIEAKVVYQGNATNAVREAIGQLLQYRHFLYPPGSGIRLVALFTEEVGQAYVEFLQQLGIRSIWKGSAGWEGDSIAVAEGLV